MKKAKSENSWSTSSVFRIALVTLIYFCIGIYYLGPSVTKCSTVTYGFGDNTAGPIWQFETYPQSPVGGFISKTNFPFGENISSPVSYSLILQKGYIWGVQKLAGAICGYNLVNLIGFAFSALSMLLFIYWLTKNKWIAFLAGYLVSFSPYFQFKVGGHPSYGYQGLIILSIWMLLVAHIEKRKAAVAGFVCATIACFYWDPYFSLLVTTAVFPIIFAMVLSTIHNYGIKNYRKIIKEMRPVIIGCLGVILLLLPLAAVNVKYRDVISSYATGARGNLIEAANKCSNLPTDYVIPPDANYFYSKVLGPGYGTHVLEQRHGCNTSEQNVAISYPVLMAVFFGGTVVVWDLLNKRNSRIKGTLASRPVVWTGLISVALAAIILALPPTMGPIKTPTFILLNNVQIWRILSREFIVLHIALIGLFSIIILYFSKSKLLVSKRNLKILIYLTIFLTSFIQYQTAKPFAGSTATFDYIKNTPETYRWLERQTNIKVIADYPLDKVGETEAPSYYLTAQTIHNKKLLNSSLPNSPQESVRFSIKDLTDPQTIPVLRKLGVDAVIIHGVPKSEIEAIQGLKLLRYDYVVDKFSGGSLAVAKITSGIGAESMVVLQDGFPINGNIMKSAVNIEYEVIQGAEIISKSIAGTTKQQQNVCFELKMADNKDSAEVFLRDGRGRIIRNQQINGKYQKIEISYPYGGKLNIENSNGHNMRINNLGCF